MIPVKRALCIGINDYAGTGSDLSGCVNDAYDWAVALSRRGYACELLIDGGATKANIVARLEELVASMRPRDQLVVTYSGHGSWVSDAGGDEPDGRDECWVAADLGYITDDELAGILDRRPVWSRVVVFSDSCHSGSVLRAVPTVMGQPRFLPPDAIRADVDWRAGRQPTRPMTGGHKSLLLSGCADDEYSYDAWFDGRANGAFTRAAIDALRLPVTNYASWHKRIREVLPSSRHPQTPQIRGAWRMRRIWRVLR